MIFQDVPELFEISKIPKIDFPRCTQIPKNDLPECTKIPRFMPKYQKIPKTYPIFLKIVSDLLGFTGFQKHPFFSRSQRFIGIPDVDLPFSSNHG